MFGLLTACIVCIMVYHSQGLSHYGTSYFRSNDLPLFCGMLCVVD